MKKTILFVLVLAFIIGLIPGVAKAKLVACVGDSITYGMNLPNRVSNCYPAQLAVILQEVDNEWETGNFGVNGATVLRNGSKPYVVQNAYNSALVSDPEVVIIMLGTNDSVRTSSVLEHYVIPDYLALIDAFAQLPSQPRIFICYPPPILGGTWAYCNPVIRDEIIPLINQVAELRDVGLIDVYTPFEHSGHLFPDGIHPNAEGARLIAELIAATILGHWDPDLNGDEMVNFKDFCMLAQYWHEDQSPFVNHKLDCEDLARLAQYWLVEFGLVAHWKLDEAEGFMAHDSAGDHDGFVLSASPLWRPANGQINGGLELDGIDDFVSVPFVLDPADGPFSVFAWIKGGEPGQVIISQIDGTGTGATWLGADPLDGTLVSALVGTGRFAGPVVSDSVITDGRWHRIGLVWDGSHRTLYVDDTEAAKDAQPQGELISADGGLYFGTGKDKESGSFFSGLIDDVRIYDRAVTP